MAEMAATSLSTLDAPTPRRVFSVFIYADFSLREPTSYSHPSLPMPHYLTLVGMAMAVVYK